MLGNGAALTEHRQRWRDGHRRRCEREARREVVAVAGDKPDTGTVTPRHDPEAIVLDLVNPAIAGRWPLGWRWQTRWMKSTQTQHSSAAYASHLTYLVAATNAPMTASRHQCGAAVRSPRTAVGYKYTFVVNANRVTSTTSAPSSSPLGSSPCAVRSLAAIYVASRATNNDLVSLDLSVGFLFF
jgi:hypothetical protein